MTVLKHHMAILIAERLKDELNRNTVALTQLTEVALVVNIRQCSNFQRAVAQEHLQGGAINT